jgi:hypothetical protein
MVSRSEWHKITDMRTAGVDLPTPAYKSLRNSAFPTHTTAGIPTALARLLFSPQ